MSEEPVSEETVSEGTVSEGTASERTERPPGARLLEGWNDPARIDGAVAAWRERRPVLLLNPAHRALPGVSRWLEALGVPREAHSGARIPPDAPLLQGLPEGFHALLFTSGTTGTPRLVALDETSVRWNIETLARHLGLRRGIQPRGAQPRGIQVALQVPIFHAFGLVLGLLMAHELGGRAHPFERFDAAALLAWLEGQTDPVLLPFVPAMVRSLPEPEALGASTRQRLAGVRGVAIVGGDRVTRADLARLGALLPGVHPTVGYGLTEAGPALAHTRLGDGEASPGEAGPGEASPGDPGPDDSGPDGGIGAPLPGVELVPDAGGARFRSPGQAAFLREPGGPWRASGRMDQGAGPGAGPGARAGELLETGDLLEPLADGTLRFAGRTAWTFKKQGETVNPALLEEALVGELRADGWADGAIPPLLVTPGPGEALRLLAEGSPSEALVAALHKASHTLPRFFRPEEVTWVSELPRNALGKVDRAAAGRAGVAGVGGLAGLASDG